MTKGYVKFHDNINWDQVLALGKLLHGVHCIYFVFSCWSVSCATWPTCPWPPKSTSWDWKTLKCCTFHLLCLFMLIVLMCNMTYFDTYALQVHVRGHQDQLLVVGELEHAAHCIFFKSSWQSSSCAAWPTSTLLPTSCPRPWPPRSTSWGWRTWKKYHGVGEV